MISSKFIIVVAGPGLRGDFVAGWLGSLPNFVDTQWRVDPYTGRSLGLMNCFRQIDDINFNGSFQDIIANRNYQIDENSKTIFAMSCHGWAISKYFSNHSINGVKILHISGEYCRKVKWEFFVKTWLTKDRSETYLNQSHREYHDISNYFNNMSHPTPLILLDNVEYSQIEYTDIVKQDGSYRLSELLGLDVHECYHQLWRNNLSLSHSISVYTEFEREWRMDQIPV